MTKTTSFQAALRLWAVLLFGVPCWLWGQQPVFTAPAQPIIYSDFSNNDPTVWNNVLFKDPLVLLNNLAETSAPFEVEVTDSCTTGMAHYRFVLEMDLNGDGQPETRVDSDSLPSSAGVVHFGNMLSSSVLGGTVTAFDTRPVTMANKYRFLLNTVLVSPNKTILRINWKTDNTPTPVEGQLPYGTHSVRWFATNGCGETAEIALTGTVRDTKKPTVVCLNGLSVNLMAVNGGFVSLWASDFLQYVEDNHTPTNKMKIMVRKAGVSADPPANSLFNNPAALTYTCDDLGYNLVELWSLDTYGNKDYCETYILVQDFAGICTTTEPQVISGTITTEIGEGIADVLVWDNVFGGPSLPPDPVTDSLGQFNISTNLPLSTIATVTPGRDDDHLNGVNVFDLVLISRHILGIEPLDSPYKLISADANRSGTVTTFDLFQLNQLILGTFNKLPNNASWRFLDKSYVFINPLNPFAEPAPEYIVIGSLPADSLDFIGFKIGDVDLSAMPNFTEAPQDRVEQRSVVAANDMQFAENEIITVPFVLEGNLAGYQMTVHLGSLEVLEILPEGALTQEHFVQWRHEGSNMLSMVSGMAEHRFSLRLRATQAGKLSDWLHIEDRDDQRPSVGFDQSGTPHRLLLALRPSDAPQPYLLQVAPNPFRDRTSITFHQPEAGLVLLRVYDMQGRLVHSSAQDFPSGISTLPLTSTDWSGAGAYRFVLQANGAALEGNLLLMK